MRWRDFQDPIIKINDTIKEVPASLFDTTVTIALEKRGSVFRVFVDGQEYLVARYDQFTSDQAFTIEIERTYGIEFSLLRITGTAL